MSEKGSPPPRAADARNRPSPLQIRRPRRASRSWPATCYANGQQADEHNERIRGGSLPAEVVTHTVTATLYARQSALNACVLNRERE